MKIRHVVLRRACSNMSRTRLAPTPTNISTKSEPLMLKKLASASPAMALASSVFPVPGEPAHQPPLGTPPAEPLKFLRVLQKFDQFRNFFDRLVHARHIL